MNEMAKKIVRGDSTESYTLTNERFKYIKHYAHQAPYWEKVVSKYDSGIMPEDLYFDIKSEGYTNPTDELEKTIDFYRKQISLVKYSCYTASKEYGGYLYLAMAYDDCYSTLAAKGLKIDKTEFLSLRYKAYYILSKEIEGVMYNGIYFYHN